MTDLAIVRGYIPEISMGDRRFDGELPLSVGWLRLAELVIADEQEAVPNVELPFRNVPIGVEDTRYAWEARDLGFKGETPLAFVGIIALNNNVLRVEGLHYRSGARLGQARASQASEYDIDRYSIVIELEELTVRRDANSRRN